MQPTFTYLQTLDAYNHPMARNNPAYHLIVNEQARPCFFSGDIEKPGKVIMRDFVVYYTHHNRYF